MNQTKRQMCGLWIEIGMSGSRLAVPDGALLHGSVLFHGFRRYSLNTDIDVGHHLLNTLKSLAQSSGD
jgi:hypothetical protein